jgi:hypothetical protein
MIAAGVNAKALSTFMGHANIRITLEQYGQLLPGVEDFVRDMNGSVVLRERGSIWLTVEFETLGDSQPRGELVAESPSIAWAGGTRCSRWMRPRSATWCTA